jgi:hypothetical protein
MASFAEEKRLRAHLLLIAEAGTYAGYFSQGTNADGDASAYYLTNDSDETAAETLLDAKIGELTDELGGETPGGEGAGNFDGYTAIHYDDTISESGVDYRAWFVDANGDYFKADNGNSDSIEEVTDSSEISTLLTDSGYIVA